MKHHDDNLPEDPDFSFNKEEKHPFGLPSGYFSSFEDKLKNKLEAEHELKEFPLLSSIQKEPVFGVPEHYFGETEKTLEHNTGLSAYAVLQSLEKPAFAALEEDYQQQLSQALNHKLSVLDELKPYTSLYGLDKGNGFIVADEYFDTLSERVKERIHAGNRMYVSAWDKIWNLVLGGRTAWAFGLALIIGLAFYFNQQTVLVPVTGDCQTLACLERDEILNNKAITNLDEEQLMDLVDVNSLGKQLKLDIAQQDSLRGKDVILQNTDTEDLLDAL